MSDVIAPTRLAKVVYVAADAEPLELVINKGADDGIRLGQRFLVYGCGPQLKDPETGADLGVPELVRGRGEVVHVQDHLATLRSIETTPPSHAKEAC